MSIKKLSIKELIYHCSLRGNIGSGCQGIINKYDDSTVLKIYYSYIYSGYNTLDPEILTAEIEDLKRIENILIKNGNYIGRLGKLRYLHQKLSLTRSPIIKSIALCNDYPVGVFLEYYKDYESICKCFNSLKQSDKKIVLERIKGLIDDLVNHDIYPTDLHLNNIIIDKKTLSVKLIDLDDYKTVVEPKKHIKKISLLKKECYKSVKKLKETIN